MSVCKRPTPPPPLIEPKTTRFISSYDNNKEIDHEHNAAVKFIGAYIFGLLLGIFVGFRTWGS